MPNYEIWSEGFACTGEHGIAIKHGEAEGENFKDACDNRAKDNPRFASNYEAETVTYWGCRLYNNETDARRSFG